jgi:deoxyribonuclease V
MQALRKISETPWPTSAAEAVVMQQSLRHQIVIENRFTDLKLVAGVDVSYDLKANMSHASVVLMALDMLVPLQSAKAQLPTEFPYIPGFLSFREIPVVLEALAKLHESPDLLMVDGQGIAHPRRLGIAAHLGVLLDMPAIGVAKSRLTGRFQPVGPHKGDSSLLLDKQERIGTVLRSKDNVNPLFISPGHRVDHATAVKLVMSCLTKYRLPEPTRIADKFSKERD